MGPKKINLKTSVSDVIAKTAVAKKKALPKLKVILANPYKPIYETLADSELSQFNDIICSDIKSSGLPGIQFARQNKIKLGLGASLRAIKNKQASCVLVSRSIKPKFIIDQIGSFAKQTKSLVPVFVVDDCDKISTHLFAIRALVVVFPLNISGELGKWIAKRTLPSKENRISVKEKEPVKQALVAVKEVEDKVNLNDIYLTKQSNGRRTFVPDVVVKPKPVQNNESKNWTGDFISFSNKNGTDSNDEEPMDTDQIDEEFIRKQEKALMVLEKIAKSKQKINVESVLKTESKSKSKEDKSAGQTVDKKLSDRVIVHEEWENDPSYISLEVHKIQPNPNRKPKNKRNKNKNKNKNKIKVP